MLINRSTTSSGFEPSPMIFAYDIAANTDYSYNQLLWMRNS